LESTSGNDPDFLGDKPKPRESRGFLRVFSIIFTAFPLIASGLFGWFSYQETSWSEAEAEVLVREERNKGVDLGIVFYTLHGAEKITIVREYETVHAVGAKVRIRFSLRDSGEVSNARLAEEPIWDPSFFVTAGTFAVIGLGLVYWSWFRMPPDRKSPSARRRRT
jgi:hypothetical protein